MNQRKDDVLLERHRREEHPADLVRRKDPEVAAQRVDLDQRPGQAEDGTRKPERALSHHLHRRLPQERHDEQEEEQEQEEILEVLGDHGSPKVYGSTPAAG